MCESGLRGNVSHARLGELGGVLGMTLVFVQERRVNAVQAEMQHRLLAKEEKLKQVKAILVESQDLHSPRQRQMQYWSSKEVLCEQSPASLTLSCVCS